MQQQDDRPFGQRGGWRHYYIVFFCLRFTSVSGVYWMGKRNRPATFISFSTWWTLGWSFSASMSRQILEGILVPTQGEWCAFINNDRIGGMPSSELLVIPERLGIRSVSFVLDDLQQRRREKNPYAAMFGYCDATRGRRGEGAVERYVGVVWNGGGGGWEYQETGDPLPFEEVEAYKSRKKADPGSRLTCSSAMPVLWAFVSTKGTLSTTCRKPSALPGHGQDRRRNPHNIIMDIADRINKELGSKWKIHLFRR